jgi:hypothetical protein
MLSDEHLLQLRIAEYEALMARNSYLIQIQFAFWPAALVILAISAQVWTSPWGSKHGWGLTWCTFAGMLTIAITWAHTVRDMYHNISYIEQTLKPQISKSHSAHFWGYEAYQRVRRGRKWLPEEMLVPFVACMNCLGLIVARARDLPPPSYVEIAGMTAILLLTILLCLSWLHVRRLRMHLVQDELLLS